MVSLMKAWWGDAATAENHWAYDYLPKLDKFYDTDAGLRAHEPGQDDRLHLPGLQSAGASPGKYKQNLALAEVAPELRVSVASGSITTRNLSFASARFCLYLPGEAASGLKPWQM